MYMKDTQSLCVTTMVMIIMPDWYGPDFIVHRFHDWEGGICFQRTAEHVEAAGVARAIPPSVLTA
jgi:hypothetical protein